METILMDNYGRELKVSHRGRLIIFETKSSDGKPVIFEGNADEILNAVKAHHAMTKVK